MKLEEALLSTESSAWARFLGAHLPPRELDLRFDLLPPNRRGKKPIIEPRQLRQLAAEHDKNVAALLRELGDEIRTLNRYRLPPKRRLELAEMHLSLLMPPAVAMVQDKLQERGGVPENSQRADLLTALCTAFQVLVTTYQIILGGDYDRSRFWYVRIRGRVHLCAHRIIDLIGLIQQIGALRYQRLSDANWRVATTVFCVMLDCEQVDIPLPTPGSLLTPAKTPAPKSIRECYAALQIPWILDFQCWPEAELPFVVEYCQSIHDGVRIFGSNASVCGNHQALTRCYHAAEPTRAAKRRPGGDDDGPTLLIDYQVLAAHVATDFKELSKARASRNPFLLPRRLATISADRQLTVGHRMMQLVAPIKAGQLLDSPLAKQQDLRIHVGFAEVHAHLQTIFSSDKTLATKRQLSNLFARRSALIGEDHTAAEESRWYILQVFSDRVRLRTQETRYTTAIVIGSLMVYGHGEEGIRTPALGKVARIFRPESRMVLVDVSAFAEYARPVVVCSAEDGLQDRDNPNTRALLVHSGNLGWGLLLPDQTRFWIGTQVIVEVGNRLNKLRLLELRDIGEGYALFGVDARTPEDKPPRYPAPRADRSSGSAATGYFEH